MAIRIERWEENPDRTLEDAIHDACNQYDVESLVTVVPTQYIKYHVTSNKTAQEITKADIIVNLKRKI